MLKITSRDNQRLKSARETREGKVKEAIFVEGVRLANESLRSNLKINEVFCSESFARNDRGKDLLENFSLQNIEVFEVSEQIFNSLSDTKNSQGIILIAEKPQTGQKNLETLLINTQNQFPLILLLHKINNPSNLGAILRTSEAAGVCGIILTKNSTHTFSPKALRASMGAAFRLPIWENAEFEDVLSWTRDRSFVSVCADVNAEKSYLEIDWKKPRLLIFGSEAHGLSFEERNQIDEGLIIPMENNVESLNLAVSCGIILFEAKRQSEN